MSLVSRCYHASLDAAKTIVNGSTPTLEQNLDAVNALVNEGVFEQEVFYSLSLADQPHHTNA